MPKRKSTDTAPAAQSTPSKRVRRTAEPSSTRRKREIEDLSNADHAQGEDDSVEVSPSEGTYLQHEDGSDAESDEGSPTPRANGVTQLVTPKRSSAGNKPATPKSGRADRSAKRKSVQTLASRLEDGEEEEDWDHSAELAKKILDAIPEQDEVDDHDPDDTTDATTPAGVDSAATTPRRGRGRPKGAKNKRSPTPEGDLAPEERYFFQNRAGPPQVSGNSFVSLGLLSHEEYFEQMRNYNDPYVQETAYMEKLHARSFPQWRFELQQGFGVCLYGFGSKRRLVNKFIEWLYYKDEPRPQIVVINGYMAKVNLRTVLNTIASTLVDEGEQIKLVGSPSELVDALFEHLVPFEGVVTVVVNSIDGPSLRRPAVQELFARLAAHEKINFVATADTPTFQLLWNSALKDQFKFVFHDCTTYAPYDAETSPVDDVNDLLGRRGRRTGGKDGIEFVLKSLPQNAKNLYRILLTEILTLLNDDIDEVADADEEDLEGGKTTRRGGPSNGSSEAAGVEYRTLYQKASEEFICSSDMNFRFLLKEFHDHRMLTSGRDASGTEILGVPLSKDEMEAVLEELIL